MASQEAPITKFWEPWSYYYYWLHFTMEHSNSSKQFRREMAGVRKTSDSQLSLKDWRLSLSNGLTG
jgi:hypothetical protein